MPNSGTKPNESKISIVFFGSGPVAGASLDLLMQSFAIEAVVTKPRPAHHHGSVPVLEAAEAHGLRVIEVSSKREVSEKVAAERFVSDVAVLIDFGIIVSQDVIDVFPLGIVNSHFSLLPEWRGADPITFAILSGQKRTGVSLMLLVEAMDEGPIIGFGIQELDDTITTPILTDQLIQLSYALLCNELPRYVEKAQKTGIPQSELPKLVTDFVYPAEPSYSRKLTKEDSTLDFNKSADVLEREIRAYAEWPKSRCNIGDHAVIVTKAAVVRMGKATPGKLMLEKKRLFVGTAEDWLEILRLKPAGKPEMTAEAFLAGYGNRLKNEA
jgi:methionyl-tRNA formyltransferase